MLKNNKNAQGQEGDSLPVVQFYHLLTTPINIALPKLLEKAYEQNINCLISGDVEQCKYLDSVLWEYSLESFLPHNLMGGDNDNIQPILLCSDAELATENINNSIIFISVNGEYDIEKLLKYERVFDIFNGANENHVVNARIRWKSLKDKNIKLTYARQKENGGWEMKG